MPQQQLANSQEMTVGGGGFNISGGFLTGTTCTSSGTYSAENKYLRSIIVLAAGEQFPPFTDGKKVYWTALSQTLSASKTSDGGFSTVKVEAGAI